jgi:hypothetical protein
MTGDDSRNSELRRLSFTDFLLKSGPNESVEVQQLWHFHHSVGGGKSNQLDAPKDLLLECSECVGKRTFGLEGTGYLSNLGFANNVFLRYKCKNCEKQWRTYALRVIPNKEPSSGSLLKYGEWPPFGMIVDPKVAELLGDEVELFRKGLNSEAKSLGIGAFAYYRRVLERQRAGIFDRVILAAEKLEASPETVAELRKAKADRQFTKGLDAIKPGVLQGIYINGHNPLTLLYDEVSDGLHAQSDAEILENAQTIRLLLVDLASRLEIALSEDNAVTEAVNKLLKRQAQRRNPERE